MIFNDQEKPVIVSPEVYFVRFAKENVSPNYIDGNIRRGTRLTGGASDHGKGKGQA